jgi:hypothetical protein
MIRGGAKGHVRRRQLGLIGERTRGIRLLLATKAHQQLGHLPCGVAVAL